MAKKKGNEPELTDADQALVKRVDAMMDVKHPEYVPQLVSGADDVPAPIDIFDGQPPATDKPTGSAPVVPSKLLKDIGEKKSKKTAPLKSSPEAVSETVAEPVEATPPAPESESDADPAMPASDAPDPLADTATEKAVDDIVSEDSDDLLKVNKLPQPASKVPAAQTAPSAKAQKIEHHNPANLITLTLFTIVLLVLLALYLTHHSL